MTHTKKPQRKVGEAKSDAIRDVPAACADEAVAVAYLERLRWPGGVCCPRCGDTDVVQIKAKDGTRGTRFLWRCHGCHGAKRHAQFTWRIGTPAEDSRIPARIWVHAFWRAVSSKKGVSALQIKRETGLSYESALFLMHRIRFAMSGDDTTKFDGVVEVDETYVGGKPRRTHGVQGAQFKRGHGTTKTQVMGLVKRGGNLRLCVPTGRVTSENVRSFLTSHVEPSARLITDESKVYDRGGREFASHEKVAHARHEYVRGDVTTNTIEGAFSLLKRALYGTWHAVSKHRLGLYLDEVEFRYNTRHLDDGARLAAAIQAGNGKRLMAQ
jgi:transposase-like protein